MPALATEKDVFLDHFAQFDNHWPDAPFARHRQAARKRFRELSFPGPKTEDWRFTNLSSMWKIPFELALDTAGFMHGIRWDHDRQVQLTFSTGRFTAPMSSSHFASPIECRTKLPDGIVVGNLADELLANRWISTIADYRDQVFTALNTSLFHDGAFIKIHDGVVLEEPIIIDYSSDPGNTPRSIHPRVLIVVGNNSRATILERYGGEGVYFNNAVTEIAIGNGAVVDHYKLQEDSLDAFHLASTQVVLGGKSNFTSQYLCWGAKLSRNEVRVRFDAEGSEATVNGLYVGNDRQLVDNFTVIDHAQPRCASHELYKGILNGQAQGVFNGKIFVRPDAQKTDAKQTNKVLLLSENATIHTKPQLEIFADDVKCTHGATVGQLDAEQVFYLRSRGLSLQAARELLTYAFVNDIVERVKLPGLRDHLEKRLLRGF